MLVASYHMWPNVLDAWPNALSLATTEVVGKLCWIEAQLFHAGFKNGLQSHHCSQYALSLQAGSTT